MKYRNYTDQYSTIVAVITRIANIEAALDSFHFDIGRYPAMHEGLRALIECPAHIPAEKWHGPYLFSVGNELPRDVWGRRIHYIYPSVAEQNGHRAAYDLISAGEDGIFGSQDDITNHALHATRDLALVA